MQMFPINLNVIKNNCIWWLRHVTIGFSLLLLLCCCTACGNSQSESSTGLFSLDEIKAMEDSYGLTQAELFEKISLKNSDIEYQDNTGCMVSVSVKKDICGIPFTPTFFFSGADPEGFYSVHLDAECETEQKEDFMKAYDTLAEEAISLYGEPSQKFSSSDGVTGNGLTTKWKIGTQSSATLYCCSEEPGGIQLSLVYRVVIPGSIHDF